MQFNGFRAISFMYAPGLPECQRIVIGDSFTLTEGDSTKITPSVTIPGLDPADAVTDKVYGYLEGFVNAKGLPLALGKSSDYDGAKCAVTVH